MKSLIAFLLLFVISVASFAQVRVEPPHWWAGMKNSKLQIMVHMPDVANGNIEVKGEGVEISKITAGESPNYAFIDLDIGKAPAQKFSLTVKTKQLDTSMLYELKTRTINKEDEHISSKDLIYLITPDRFANGDAVNDIPEKGQEGIDRSNDYGRHGGDIKGISNHLDYISELGFTTIWLNPVLENYTTMSYHGYATTDFYNVDSRFGSNEEYEAMIVKAKKNGLKVIMDQIVNHCSHKHWWMSDLPFSDWINNDGIYINTSHKHNTTIDPYVAESEKKLFTDGWFVRTMPDLNQKNDFLATYLIQNSIWWIEYSGIAGIRQDTYPYADEQFLSQWSCAIMNEYPQFFIVGEEWSTNPLITSYWQAGSKLGNPESCLPSVMDFPFQNALAMALQEEENWNTGLVNLYEILSNDVAYGNPQDLVIFGDNHDMDRFFKQVNNDMALFKMGMAVVYTMRGIPQVYYGTEVVLSNRKDGDHGEIREEMPGGWKDHPKNAFTQTGLSKDQLEALSFMRKLGQFRKKSTAIHLGRLTHFAPTNGLYAYKRERANETILVVINKSDQKKEVDWARFGIDINSQLKISTVLSEKLERQNGAICTPAMSVEIFEIRPE